LSGLAELALAGAVIAEALVAPPLRRGASPTPRRGGAGRRRYRRGACGARRLAELALSGGADADEAASGQLHMIISFFVCTRRAGAGRRRYR